LIKYFTSLARAVVKGKKVVCMGHGWKNSGLKLEGRND
jgi:hypothetical protein